MSRRNGPADQLAALILGFLEGGIKGIIIAAIICLPLFLVFLYIVILALS